MSDFDRREECPHCDAAPPSRQLDIHVARTHADLPPCTARIETEHRETYRCAFRAGHEKDQYGKWHASARGDGDVTARYVWNDSAKGATPHRAPEPSYSLDKLKAMGVLSHTIVAASKSAPDGPCVCDAAGSPGVSRCLLTCPRRAKRSTGDPCTRPECGGEQHTDPWGTPVHCPHAEPVVQADTGRRCPRCDCPDGHEQCQHCKVCPHADGRRRSKAHSVSTELAEAKEAIARVRAVLAERRTEVAEREADGMLPFGTPGASWCDAVTVTCARVEDALRVFPPSVAVPEPNAQEAP